LKDFRKLKVWEKSHCLTAKIYQVTKGFPREELYGLTSQMRRSGLSIPANMVEGCGKESDAELARYLSIAMGSACELEYHLLLGRDVGFLKILDYEALNREVIEIKQMPQALSKS
jgi:four helix bundle protein